MAKTIDTPEPPPRPFRELRELPPELRIPSWISFALACAIALGFVSGGLLGGGPAGQRVARAVFCAALYSYLLISVVDFAEHYRLEHAVTGKWFTMQVVPIGESVNHLFTIGVLVSFSLLARPFPGVLEPRDWIVLIAPAVFLGLGWRDEVVYHRRRAAHREDILHTTAHLAAAAMLAAQGAHSLIPWR